jgi:hypothetical protein
MHAPKSTHKVPTPTIKQNQKTKVTIHTIKQTVLWCRCCHLLCRVLRRGCLRSKCSYLRCHLWCRCCHLLCRVLRRGCLRSRCNYLRCHLCRLLFTRNLTNDSQQLFTQKRIQQQTYLFRQEYRR